MRLLDEAGIGIDDIAVRRPTLDDVFLRLTGHAAEVDADTAAVEDEQPEQEVARRTMVDAARALFVGTPAGNDVWGAVVWAIVITAVFGALSVWRYRRAVTR